MRIAKSALTLMLIISGLATASDMGPKKCADTMASDLVAFRGFQLEMRTYREQVVEMSDDILEQMMAIWVDRTIKKDGYLPGLAGHAGEPTDFQQLKLASTRTWRAIYSNTVAVLMLYGDIWQNRLVVSNISTIRAAIFDALLVHEYVSREKLKNDPRTFIVAYLGVEDAIQKISNL